MKSLLLVALSDGAADSLFWMHRTARGDISRGRVSADARLPAAARAERVVAIAPGADVAVHRVPATKGSLAQARNAALFAVEDDIALDLDEVHLALGSTGEDGKRSAAIVSKAAIDRWRTQLSDFGIVADQIIPDFLAAPRPEGGAVIVDAGDAILVNTGEAGVAIEPDLATAVLPPLFDETEWTSIEIWSDRASALGLETLRVYGPLDIRPALGDDELAAMLMDGVDNPGIVDLLQGEYAPRGQVVRLARSWRPSAALAAALVLAWLGVTVAETWAYRGAARAARTQAMDVYKSAFPDEARVVDPTSQMRSKLAAVQGLGSGLFLDLSAVLVSAIQTAPGVELEGVRFVRQDGALTATLIYDNFDDVAALTASMEEAGVAVTDQGSRSRGARQSGELELRVRS